MKYQQVMNIKMLSKLIKALLCAGAFIIGAKTCIIPLSLGAVCYFLSLFEK